MVYDSAVIMALGQLDFDFHTSWDADTGLLAVPMRQLREGPHVAAQPARQRMLQDFSCQHAVVTSLPRCTFAQAQLGLSGRALAMRETA